MALTVTQAWADVKSRVNSIGDVDTTQQIQLADIVNREIRDEIINSDPEQLISAQTINVVADTASYALPADFETAQATGCGLFVVDSDGNDTDTQRILTSFGSQKEGFYLDSDNTVLTPIPSDTETLKLRYIPDATEITAVSDNFIVDQRFRELVRAGLLAQYYWQKGGFEDISYSNWNAEYSARLEEFSNKIRRIPNIGLLQDISSAY